MKLIFAALAVCIAGAANALTVTFDIDPVNDPFTQSHKRQGTSQGFTFEWADVYTYGNYINFHDDSGVLSTTIKPVNGGKFTVQTVDLQGWSRAYTTGSGPAPAHGTAAYNQWITGGPATFPTLTFSGLLNGSVVATQTFGPMALTTLSFSSAFTAIDSLLVTYNSPSLIRHQALATSPNTAWCASYCGEMWVDNLVVAPVPLPASGFLLIGGLMGLFGFRRFKAP